MSELQKKLKQIKDKTIFIRATKREADILDRYCKAMKIPKSVVIRLKIINQLEPELSKLLLEAEEDARADSIRLASLDISSSDKEAMNESIAKVRPAMRMTSNNS